MIFNMKHKKIIEKNKKQTMYWTSIYLYILSSNGTIYTEKYVTITKSGIPELQFTIDKNVLSMKFRKENFFEPFHQSVMKIIKYENKYRLKFFDTSLYDSPNDHELIGSTFISDDKNFLFDILPVKNGIKIYKNNRCIEKLGWNEQRNGFYLGLMPCVNNMNQIFTIRPIIICNSKNKTNLPKINLNIIKE